MSLFGCTHRWVEVGRTFTEPSGAMPKLSNASEWLVNHLYDRAMVGFTNIEQRCEVCGKVDVTRVTGKVES